MLSNCGAGEDCWESIGQQGDQTGQFQRKWILNIHWKDWWWSLNSNILATWCEELTHLKRPWFWERLKAGGEGDDREWEGWMALPTRWTWTWASSGSWWWPGKPGMLQVHVVAKSQTRLSNWTELKASDKVGQTRFPEWPRCLLTELLDSETCLAKSWASWPSKVLQIQ